MVSWRLIGGESIFPCEFGQRDARPCLYVQKQEYEVDGVQYVRQSFMGLLQLEEGGAGVHAHEKTHDEPKQDRLRLMRATEANDEPIFMLYRDSTRDVDSLLEPQGSPLAEARDDFEVLNRFWRVEDPDLIAEVQKLVARRDLYIADGHHRFETSLNFMRECRSKGWRTVGAESFDKRLVACVALEDPGLKIQPTHHLIRDLPEFSVESFVAGARRHFEVKPVQNRDQLFDEMQRAETTVIGLYAGGQSYYALKLKDRGAACEALPSMSVAYCELDVVVLHVLLLEPLLGINDAKLAGQAHVDYARDRNAALNRVAAGRYQAAFLLNATRVEQVHAVAAAGERMPQKSTDFYPKMLTGLVLSRMEIDKS